MFPAKAKKSTGGRKVIMRMMGLSGAGPLSTIGLSAMAIPREMLHYALSSTGYLSEPSRHATPFIRYEALLMLLYKHYGTGLNSDSDYDSAFLRATAEMTAMWRYDCPVSEDNERRSREWVLTTARLLVETGSEIKNVFLALLNLIQGILNEPPVDLDEEVNLWTSNKYTNLTNIPAFTYFAWISKLVLKQWGELCTALGDLGQKLVNPYTTVSDLTQQLTTCRNQLAALTDANVEAWWNNLSPHMKLVWWELKSAAREETRTKLHNSAIFLSIAAMSKTGTVTENWLTNRRGRWGDEIKKSIDDDMLTGVSAIRAYFDKNHPTEQEKEVACQFLAASYFAAKQLHNDAIAWMIEQSRNHNIAAAVAFATLIIENDYVSLTAIMRAVSSSQFDNLLTVMLYAIQDPFANYIYPKVYSSQYRDLAQLGTVYLNATSGISKRANLTNRSQDMSKKAAIERELTRLIGEKSSAEAVAMFDNTSTAMSELGYERYFIDRDVVYVDPAGAPTDPQLPQSQDEPISRDDLYRLRRAWPVEARDFSARAKVIPIQMMTGNVLRRETLKAQAYKQLLGEFLSSCQQVTMHTVEHTDGRYRFVSRVKPLSAAVLSLINTYNATYDPPIVAPNPAGEILALKTFEECFKILFNPISVATTGNEASDIHEVYDVVVSPAEHSRRTGIAESGIEIAGGTTPETNERQSSDWATLGEPGPSHEGITGRSSDTSSEGVPAQTEMADQSVLQYREAFSQLRVMLRSMLKASFTEDIKPLTTAAFNEIWRDLVPADVARQHADNDAKELGLIITYVLDVMDHNRDALLIQDDTCDMIQQLLESVVTRFSMLTEQRQQTIIAHSTWLLNRMSAFYLEMSNDERFVTLSRPIDLEPAEMGQLAVNLLQENLPTLEGLALDDRSPV